MQKGEAKLWYRRSFIVLASFGWCVACQSMNDLERTRYGCGDYSDSRAWVSLETPPEAADKLGSIADQNAFEPKLLLDFENWFSLSSGEIMLCRSDLPLKYSYQTEWWIFDTLSNIPSIEAHDGTITIRG